MERSEIREQPDSDYFPGLRSLRSLHPGYSLGGDTRGDPLIKI
jgi:hypothetical protein